MLILTWNMEIKKITSFNPNIWAGFTDKAYLKSGCLS